jgi:hypothetical protein
MIRTINGKLRDTYNSRAGRCLTGFAGGVLLASGVLVAAAGAYAPGAVMCVAANVMIQDAVTNGGATAGIARLAHSFAKAVNRIFASGHPRDAELRKSVIAARPGLEPDISVPKRASFRSRS